MTKTRRSFDRAGAVAGVVSVALLVAILMFVPALPAADEPIRSIARAAADDSRVIHVGAYLGALLGGAMLMFGAVVAARLRRAEGSEGGWWIVALAGMTAAASIGAASDLLNVIFVRAVSHGATGEALWTAYGGDLAGFLQAVPYGIFMLGAGMGVRTTGALPRWTGFLALAAALLLVVGGGSIAGGEVDGGLLGAPLMLGYLGMLVWMLRASVSLWRGPGARNAEAVPSPVMSHAYPTL
jgi:hypothetical protein